MTRGSRRTRLLFAQHRKSAAVGAAVALLFTLGAVFALSCVPETVRWLRVLLWIALCMSVLSAVGDACLLIALSRKERSDPPRTSRL